MSAKPKLAPGQRFAKKEDPTTVWVVERAWFPPGLPVHYYLINERPPFREILLAESALLDKRLYLRLGERGADTTPAKRPWNRSHIDRLLHSTD
ncbi:MAG: hypothetical protein KDE22_05090 [Rhodobacterales bacterium]|nr:hypothetical protein [Rhodobacterales bacterium]